MSNGGSVLERIKAMVKDQFDLVLGDKDNFAEAGLDSLDRVDLAMAIEEEFELGELSDAEIARLKTPELVAEFVEKRGGQGE